MLRDIVPESVVVVETGDDVAVDTLWPEETSAIASAPLERRLQYATVRDCARRALVRLGRSPGPIPRGARGAPVWPDGIVGSLTHCAGYRAAAVAESRRIAAIGIDAEPALALPAGVIDRIASPAERALIDELRTLPSSPPITLSSDEPTTLSCGEPARQSSVEPAPRSSTTRQSPAGIPWDRLLFSMKESVYKAWFPLTGSGLDFFDVTITALGGGTWGTQLFVPHPVGCGTNRTVPHVPPVPGVAPLDWHAAWTIDAGLIITAVWATRRAVAA